MTYNIDMFLNYGRSIGAGEGGKATGSGIPEVVGSQPCSQGLSLPTPKRGERPWERGWWEAGEKAEIYVHKLNY